MSIGITIATVIFCFYLYQYIEEKKQAKEEKENRFFEELKNGDNHNEDVTEEPTYLDERTITGLVLCTLRKIGCEPETEERGDLTWVYFTYQGEKFTIECNDSCRFIVIYDTWWFQMSVYSDVEEIADLHKVINLANQHANVTVIHTVNQEIEEIGVHSRRNILFISQIPEIDQYLICVLNDFFKVQRYVVTELEKCKVREKQETNR
ncbi:MAG: hypothetical protein J6T44_05955 [Prevotella sp.]|nr:hypothetical protein [Prevotella sp.]